MLTPEEYFQFTGYLAPADFNSCVEFAVQQMHAQTLYAYVGRDMEELPRIIQIAWKQAIALQACAVSQNGGVAGMSQQPHTSMSLGKFSYSADADAINASNVVLSPATRAILPVLVAYGRGLQSCSRSH